MDDPLQLSATSELLAPLIESLDMGFALIDAQGQFRIWNQANSNLFAKGVALDLNPKDWPKHYGLHCPMRQRLLTHEELPLVRCAANKCRVEQEIIVLNEACPEGRWIKVTAPV